MVVKNYTVINVLKYTGKDYIYCGRPSIFGNPYSSKESEIAKYKVSTRKISIEKFKEYIKENQDIIEKLIIELQKTGYTKLGCFCYPKKCHCDILIEEINKRSMKSLF